MRNKVESLRERVNALEDQRGVMLRAEQAAQVREAQLRAQNAVLRSLSISGTIEHGDFKAALWEITEAAATALDVARVGVWVFEEDNAILRAIELYDRPANRHSSDEWLNAADYPTYFQALRENRALPAHRAQGDPRTCELTENYLKPFGITSMLDAPVRVDGKLIGVICHENVGPPRQWSVDEEIFAGSMADFVSLTLQAKRRREAEEEVERQHTYLRQILDISPNLVFVLDERGNFVTVNKALADLTGTSMDNIVGRPCSDLIKDQQQAERLKHHSREVLQTQCEALIEEVFYDTESKPHWFQIVKRPIIAVDGHTRQVLGVASDVTERKLYEQRQAMMVRELDHRVKNNLFAVLAMAEQTAISVETIQEFLPTFTGRVRAMAAAHEVIAKANWQGAELGELLRRLLSSQLRQNPEAITIEGWEITLPPSVAQGLSLAVHELVSNAVQHGALASEAGRLRITWSLDDCNLQLHWQEHGVPNVRAPERPGFGLDLIERVTRHQLRGQASIEFEPDGVSCTFIIPIEPSASDERTRTAASKPDRSE